MTAKIACGLLLLGFIATLFAVQPAAAATATTAPQILSGSVKIPVTLTSGNSLYVMSYSYPATAEVGTNFTIAVSFGVDSFTGYKEYVQDYQLSVVLPFGGSHTLNQTLAEGYSIANASQFLYLYPGSVFGPANFTFPLTAANTGLKGGQVANVNVTIGFSDDVLYDNPVNYFYPEFGSATVGQLEVQNPAAQGLNWEPFALVGVGVVLLGASFFMRRSKPPSP